MLNIVHNKTKESSNQCVFAAIGLRDGTIRGFFYSSTLLDPVRQGSCSSGLIHGNGSRQPLTPAPASAYSLSVR